LLIERAHTPLPSPPARALQDAQRAKEESERQARDAARRAAELEAQREAARLQAVEAKLAMRRPRRS